MDLCVIYLISMGIDGGKILERLAAAKKKDRGRVTLYLSKDLYSTFRDKCEEIPASVVLEELLREFVNSAPEPKAKGRK